MNLEDRLESVLEERVRPMLKSHGGEVRVVGWENGTVVVELLGACSGCPSADLSTKGFIEDVLQAEFPEVNGVELYRPVSSEMLEFARKILQNKEKS